MLHPAASLASAGNAQEQCAFCCNDEPMPHVIDCVLIDCVDLDAMTAFWCQASRSSRAASTEGGCSLLDFLMNADVFPAMRRLNTATIATTTSTGCTSESRADTPSAASAIIG
jgi:hypothetical protein